MKMKTRHKVGIFLAILISFVGVSTANAQELPYFEHTWVEGNGVVDIPADQLVHFGQTAGRVEVDFMPRQLHTTGESMRIFWIPDHLSLWVYNDGIHGAWYSGEWQRLFRARWGLVEDGVEVKIVITWDQSGGYAVIINDVVRIHDWQTMPTNVYPDPDITVGTYAANLNGTMPANGAFRLRVYDQPRDYDGCAVDVVGTINQNVPLDNSGSWAEGIDPKCSEPPVSTENPPTLTWTLPIENEDGTQITNLAGVRIFRQVHDTEDPTVTSWTGDWLPPGEYRYVSTAYTYHVPADPMANPPVYEILAAESIFSNDVFTVVGPLEVVEETAYTVVKSGGGFVFLTVGTVPLGTACDENNMVKGSLDFEPFTGYVVPVSEVTATGDIELSTVVADCS